MKKQYPHTPISHAFTLIELLVVIGIIALLSALTISVVGAVTSRSQVAETEQLFVLVGGVVEAFADETGFLPVASGTEVMPYVDGQSLTEWYPSPAPRVQWGTQHLLWRLTSVMSEDDHDTARTKAEERVNVVDPVAADPTLHMLWRTFNAKIPAAQAATLEADIDALVTDTEATEFRRMKGDEFCEDDEWYDGTESGLERAFDKSSTLTSGAGYYAPRVRILTKIEIARQRGVSERRDVERAYTTAALLGRSDISSRYRGKDTNNDGVVDEVGVSDGDILLDAWGEAVAYMSISTPGQAGRRILYTTSKIYKTHPIKIERRGRILLTDRNEDGLVSREDLWIEPSVGLAEYKDNNGSGGPPDAYDWGSFMWNALPG